MLEADTTTFEAPSHRLAVGDHVKIRCDVLAELGREVAGLPPTWFCVPAGTQGKLIGWRDRVDDTRAIIDLHGTDRRVIVFIGSGNIAHAWRESARMTRAKPAGHHKAAHATDAHPALTTEDSPTADLTTTPPPARRYRPRHRR